MRLRAGSCLPAPPTLSAICHLARERARLRLPRRGGGTVSDDRIGQRSSRRGRDHRASKASAKRLHIPHHDSTHEPTNAVMSWRPIVSRIVRRSRRTGLSQPHSVRNGWYQRQVPSEERGTGHSLFGPTGEQLAAGEGPSSPKRRASFLGCRVRAAESSALRHRGVHTPVYTFTGARGFDHGGHGGPRRRVRPAVRSR